MDKQISLIQYLALSRQSTFVIWVRLMTEISSVSTGTQTSIKRVSPTSQASNAQSAESEPLKTDAKVSESADSRISRWFAQAGVSNQKSEGFERDVAKKAERRQAIKKQRKLLNLEKVLEKALEFCPDTETVENIDADWFFSFVEMAENIYSATMQEIWGKIFAAEISAPGTFSIRTLKTLKELTQRDAQIFQSAVALAARKKGEYSPKILYGYYQKPSLMSFLSLTKNHQLNLAEFGLAYPDILSLMDAGLIYSSEIESGELSVKNRTEWRVGSFNFHLSPKRSSLFFNYYKFTPTGAELSKLVSGEGNRHYLEKLKGMLQSDFEVV